MRIMQLIPEFGLAGAEIMCENLISGLLKKGNTVFVVSFYDYHSAITERLAENGIPIYYLAKKPGFDISVYKKLYDLIKSLKPDVVHTHRYILTYAMPIAQLLGVPVKVHTLHSVATYESEKRRRFINYLLFHYGNVIPVSLSEDVQQTVIDTYHLQRHDVPVIYNGIDVEKADKKTDYAIHHRAQLLHIGRFVDVKNHKGLIDAVSFLIARGLSIDLYLIGEGPLKKEIIEYVNEQCLSDCIHFVGTVDNSFPYLREADIFVLPSLCEGMPMTLIEAMSVGVPIVASNVGGIPNMLSDMVNAIIVEPETEKIANAIECLINNPDLRKQIGENAVIRSKVFSAELMSKNYEILYIEEMRKKKCKNIR